MTAGQPTAAGPVVHDAAGPSATVALFDLGDSQVHVGVTVTGIPTDQTRDFLQAMGRLLAHLGQTLTEADTVQDTADPLARSRDRRRALGLSRRQYARLTHLGDPEGVTP